MHSSVQGDTNFMHLQIVPLTYITCQMCTNVSGYYIDTLIALKIGLFYI